MNLNRANALPSGRDTIFALASGAGRAAIAVIRISGPSAAAGLAALTGKRAFGARQATLRALSDPQSGERLDRGLVLWFPHPKSFTGEDMGELHVTGGRAVTAGLLRALARLPGFRPAEPGEFAWRAFLNGKLDLAEVEGLADLVDAETAAQRRQALRIAGGELSRRVEAIRAQVIDAMSELEAQIDFSDVEDAEAFSLKSAREKIAAAAAEIRLTLTGAIGAARLREGFEVAVTGPPNVGKSSLVNSLAKREIAIVSPLPGTTRDAIEVFVEVDGLPITLIDTAGLRETQDPIEKEGVARARRRAAEADLALWLQEAGGAASETPPKGALVVLTKADLGAALDPAALAVSAKTGAGLDALLALLAAAARQRFQGAEASLVAHERHRAALVDTLAALERALEQGQSEIELIAEDLRLAERALSRIAGRVDVEEVLSGIFARLCVGK